MGLINHGLSLYQIREPRWFLEWLSGPSIHSYKYPKCPLGYPINKLIMYQQLKRGPKEVFLSQMGISSPFLRPEDILRKDINGKYRLRFYVEEDLSSHLISNVDENMTMDKIICSIWKKTNSMVFLILKHLCYAGHKPSACPYGVDKFHFSETEEVLCRSFLSTGTSISELARILCVFRESKDVVNHRVQLCIEVRDYIGKLLSQIYTPQLS